MLWIKDTSSILTVLGEKLPTFSSLERHHNKIIPYEFKVSKSLLIKNKNTTVFNTCRIVFPVDFKNQSKYCILEFACKMSYKNWM